MTGETIVKGWVIGVAKVNTCSDPYILPILIQTTHRSREEARGIDETILVERIGDGTTQRARIGLVGRCV